MFLSGPVCAIVCVCVRRTGRPGAPWLVLLIARKLRVLTGAMRELMRKSFLLISASFASIL